MRRLGIDVGGTFTDVILFDDASGRIDSLKVPTTPDDPSKGALAGLEGILGRAGIAGAAIDFVGHGTTIATNLLIEGKGAPTALLTTRGFRDVLEIRRLSRHDRADLYDLFFANPAPLVPRRRCREIDERIGFDGSVERPLADAEIERAIGELDAEAIEAFAVCFINSHVNPDHEARVGARARARRPDLFVSESRAVNPEIHEYERASTTVVNAMLGPRTAGYIEAVTEGFARAGVESDILFMRSNGGLAASATLARLPIVLLESGPAGGVTAAVDLCRRLGIDHAITGDMGGTSFDVSLIRDRRPAIRNASRIHSHVVRAPTLDIESIGAGGGSIAWVDAGGGLRVGPESAGARPGPACYGKGGRRPTVTDCNLVLGYIDPTRVLGGDIALDVEAARAAIDAEIGAPLGLETVPAAEAVRALANALMAQAIRLVTIERGFDPRDCVYLPYGGAGPVHAVDLAQELEIPRVVIPPLPGLFSACGMLIAEMRDDLQTPVNAVLDEIEPAAIEARLAELEVEAQRRMTEAGIAPDAVSLCRRAECRYLGQAETLAVDLADGPVDDDARAGIAAGFARAHQALWNFDQPDRPVLLVNLRVQATGGLGAFRPRDGAPEASERPEPQGRRAVHLDGGFASLARYARASLAPGARLSGPAIIEEASSSIVIHAGQTARVDAERNLVIDLGGRR